MTVKKDRISRFVFIALTIAYGISAAVLFYNQLLYPVTGRFESDTAVHVRFAVEEGYFHSLAAFIYIALFKTPIGNLTTALLLALMTSGAVVLTASLIKKILSVYGEHIDDYAVYIMSFFANFVMGFYIKAANKQHYIGYQNANMWHNSTYLFMRFFALITLICFLSLYEKYRDGLSVKEWVIFTLLLAVTTGFKASFLTVFAPVFAIMLLCDLITKKASFLRVFLFGLSVIPSILVMAVQSVVMSGGSSNGYSISPFTALSMRGDHPKVTLILSVLFPLVVGFFHIKDFYTDKIYFGALLLWLTGFLEVFLFLETGERELDTNFMWGYSVSLFFLFTISMIKSIRDFNRNILLSKVKTILVFSVELLILLWHVYSGVSYFILLFSGVTYFV